MIILRTKEYSSKSLQALKSALKVKDRVITAIDNSGLKAGNALKQAVTGKAPNIEQTRPFIRKTGTQLNREAVGMAQNSKDAVKKVARAAENLTYNTGPAINKGVATTVRNPIAATANILDTASVPVAYSLGGPAVGTVVAGTPLGTIGTIGEQILKKKSGAYARVTERLGKAYDRSKVSKAISNIPSLRQLGQHYGQYGYI